MTSKSPLAERLARPGPAVRLQERAGIGQLNLRGDPADAAFRAAVRGALGTEPPSQPNSVAAGSACSMLWLGPDEWLVQTPAGAADATLARLQAALAGLFSAVTDVSDGQVLLVLDDPQACELLARGCPLDFDVHAFAVGSCAQSLFQKTGVLLQREGEQRFGITVRRSFAPYFYDALQDAAELMRAR